MNILVSIVINLVINLVMFLTISYLATKYINEKIDYIEKQMDIFEDDLIYCREHLDLVIEISEKNICDPETGRWDPKNPIIKRVKDLEKKTRTIKVDDEDVELINIYHDKTMEIPGIKKEMK